MGFLLDLLTKFVHPVVNSYTSSKAYRLIGPVCLVNVYLGLFFRQCTVHHKASKDVIYQIAKYSLLTDTDMFRYVRAC